MVRKPSLFWPEFGRAADFEALAAGGLLHKRCLVTASICGATGVVLYSPPPESAPVNVTDLLLSCPGDIHRNGFTRRKRRHGGIVKQ